MTEFEQIFITSGLTIIGGIIIFVIGQLINEFLIKPFLEYKKTIGIIDEELVFYSNVYTNSGDFGGNKYPIFFKASERMRRIASKFGAVYRKMVWRKFFLSLRLIVSEDDKNIIEQNLIFISNSLWQEDFIKANLEVSKEIREILKI